MFNHKVSFPHKVENDVFEAVWYFKRANPEVLEKHKGVKGCLEEPLGAATTMVHVDASCFEERFIAMGCVIRNVMVGVSIR